MEVPASLKPFEFHGLDLSESSGDQWTSPCPFCGKRKGHFYIDPDTGQWDCKSCGEKGNLYTFLRMVSGIAAAETTVTERRQLAKDRGLPSRVFRKWGMGVNDDGKWLLPIKNAKGAVVDVRHCTSSGLRWMTTATCKVGLFGAEQLLDTKRLRETVYICEGEWDAMAFDWLLRKLNVKGVVVGVPGAGTFKNTWADWIADRNVVLMYDNDQPGDTGAEKAGNKLSGIAKSIKYLNWPESRPYGYDVRDAVVEARKAKKLRLAWRTFQKLFDTVRRRDVETEAEERPTKFKRIPTLSKVMKEFKRQVDMTADMKVALKVMLATVMSVRIPGDPVWVFVVGPPGSGKTMLLKTFAHSDTCRFESALTPHCLVSGFRSERDPSLIPKLDQRCFVLKDYTEVLSMNPTAQDEVYSTLRGAYDQHVSRTFGNGVHREYNSKFSMLAGVTSAIHGNTRATLGERFLKLQMYKGDQDYTSQIDKTLRNIGREVEMETALCDVVTGFLQRTFEPTDEYLASLVPEWVYHRINAIAQLIAVLRAEVDRERYTGNILYAQQAESGTRLAGQLLKLGQCLTVIEGKDQIDEKIFAVVERIAFDTAIGFHLNVVQTLMDNNGMGVRADIQERTGIPMQTLIRNLEDLTALNVLTAKRVKNSQGRGVKYVYTLSEPIKELWKRAEVQDAGHAKRGSLSRKQSIRIPRKRKRKKHDKK